MYFGPRVLSVSAQESAHPAAHSANKGSGQAQYKHHYTSIHRALLDAVHGDAVIVAPGTYSAATTNEVFPLFVPAGVQLLGSGASDCKVVGDERLRTSNRPLDPHESLVLLGDESGISGFTLENSGGNGLSHVRGASFLVERMVIQHNGQHGVLLYGPGQATIKDNRFYDNGTRHYEPLPPPLPISCRQGHHIYFEGKSQCRNAALIVSNKLNKSFADGIALSPSFEELAPVSMTVQVFDNDIEHAERAGILIGGSFGTHESRVSVDIRHNRIHNNTHTGIDATGALSLIPRTVKQVRLSVTIIDNDIAGSQTGISVVSGFGPAEQVHTESLIINNRMGDNVTGITATGGMGSKDRPSVNNTLRSVITNNTFVTDNSSAIVVQGAAFDDLGPAPEPCADGYAWLTDNHVVLSLHPGDLPSSAIQVDSGPRGNTVELNE